MTQEEKAKAYDKAIEIARKIHNDTEFDYESGMMEEIFPELKESEDEKIRKRLLEYFKSFTSEVSFNSVSTNDVIAWLEKQGEKKFIIDGILTATNYDKMFQNCNVHKFKVGDWVVHNKANFIFQVVSIGSYSYEVINRDNYTKTISFDNEVNYHLWTIQDAKDGDVLATDDGNICIFDGTVKDGKYPFAYCGLTRHRFEFYDKRLPFTHDNIYPATKEQCNLLFQKMKEKGYEWDAEKKRLKKIEDEPIVIDEGKAEMDYCFTKMMNGEKVGGTWSEEDEEILHEILIDLKVLQNKYDGELGKAAYQKEIDWLKSLKERVLPQPKKEWSEEDSIRLQRIIDFLWYNRKGDTDTIYQQEQDIDWLKSIKDKVQPQPKKEWSEEDEKTRKKIIKFLKEQNYFDGAVNEFKEPYKKEYEWLKSLKQKYTWRPSDEQMNALNDVISSRDIKYDVLSELWKDLKKLKGE